MPPFYSDDAVTIWHGNALDLPLEDASVDLICTSPPYFGLRAYADGGETYGGQIGSEATPGEFVDALAAATQEMARVLKPSGSIFVNLGDKYAGGGMGGHSDGLVGTRPQGEGNSYRRVKADVPAKSLMLLPERYRIRCVDDLGLIARAVIVWAKPNGLPESVRDRVRRSHEDWVHLTKEPRYFTGIDEIREPHGRTDPTAGGANSGPNAGRKHGTGVLGDVGHLAMAQPHPLGKLPGSVWTIPTQPLRVPPELGIDHFAAFPMEWPRRLIRGWSPSGICVECGEGRRPVATNDRTPHRPESTPRVRPEVWRRERETTGLGMVPQVSIVGYVCACDAPTAPTRPAVILDPFMGTGTTLVVARSLGRRGVGVDLSRDYCRLARWRVNDPKELAKAAQVKPPAKRKAKVTKLPTASEPQQESLLDDGSAA